MNEKIIASLAPMAGYTDSVFRSICGGFGADSTTSEMISSVALVHNDAKTARLARITEDEPPVFLQMFGHEPDIMAKAAEILLSGSYDGCDYARSPHGIDINMGCPVHKIVSSGDGSALMRDTDLAMKITSAVKEVCVRYGVPLSVKMRLGWDDDTINASDFAVAMAESGADVLTLHCRTKAQMYSPSAKREYCAEVRHVLDERGFEKVALIGNGDIGSRKDAEDYISLGCAGVAIARAALSDPWIFSAISSPEEYAPPTLDERVKLIGEYVTAVVDEMGEERGVRESRSRAAYLLHGIRGGAKVREALNHEVTLCGFLSELEKIRDKG